MGRHIPPSAIRQTGRKDREPFIIISNHASRVDYQFTGPVCYPNRLNYVVGI